MTKILPRPAAERGHLDFGWLKTWHTFSFGEYRDDAWMGFRGLRVINEDVVAAGAGFPPHPHRDMEIVTIPLAGAIAHRDSTGGEGVIRRGEVQRMSAGTGVTHSEFNASKTEELHLYQIWLFPRQRGIAPGYEQKAFADAELDGRLRLVASPDGREGSVTIQTDAELRHGRLAPGQSLRQPLAAGRHAWVQAVAGAATLRAGGESLALSASDGAGVSGADALEFTAGAQGAELLVFDLA
jgi:redox-sensitive bicupin YhaK (pirin superfamily)